MKTMEHILDIASRIDQLESASEWIAKETVNSDQGLSQAATFISVLADQIREQICTLVQEVESWRELHLH